jgi:hypothetical protein
MTMGQTWSSAPSGSSTNYSHDETTRMSSIIEETERIEAESEELLNAIRLAKGEEQVRAGNYSGSKWNFLKKAPAAPESKLVIEYPATLERKVWQARPTAKAATKNISSQVTKRREKKPPISAQGQEHYQNETSNAKGHMKELRLLEVAIARANQFDLIKQRESIKSQLALEKAAENKAQREAYIIMKKEKHETRRELKAAAKESKRLRIRQRAEKKAAKIAEAKMKKDQLKKKREEEEMAAMKEDLRIALALARGRKTRTTKDAGNNLTAYQKKTVKEDLRIALALARGRKTRATKDAGNNLTSYQKKTQREHDLPNYYQKKTLGARFLKNKKTRFAEFSVLEDSRDDPDEEATDLSRVKNEFIQWKRSLSRLEKEEREEAEGMGTIEKIFLCAGSLCVCANEKDSLYVATSEKESHPRKGPPSRPFARPRLNKSSLGSTSKIPNLRKPNGQHNNRPRHQLAASFRQTKS